MQGDRAGQKRQYAVQATNRTSSFQSSELSEVTFCGSASPERATQSSAVDSFMTMTGTCRSSLANLRNYKEDDGRWTTGDSEEATLGIPACQTPGNLKP